MNIHISKVYKTFTLIPTIVFDWGYKEIYIQFLLWTIGFEFLGGYR